MTKQITGTVSAFIWTKYSSIDPKTLHTLEGADDAMRSRLVSAMNFTNSESFGRDAGEYVRVGTATVTVDLVDYEVMVQGQIDALKAEKKNVQAEAQAKVNRIEDQISKLQAITFEG